MSLFAKLSPKCLSSVFSGRRAFWLLCKVTPAVCASSIIPYIIDIVCCSEDLVFSSDLLVSKVSVPPDSL